MALHPIVRLLAVSTALLCTACGEKTVVREAPVAANGESSGIETPDSGATNGGSLDGGTTDAVPDTTPGDPATDGDTPSLGDGLEDLPDLDLEPVLADPETVSGAPGQIVDCDFAVPCRWLDGENAFAITVTSADDISRTGGLSVAFNVSATHDTEVSYGGGSTAIGTNGRRFQPTLRALGPGNGLAPVGLLAGETLEGRIDHAIAAEADSLARFAVVLTDNGFMREAVFVNLPLGPLAAANIDCAMNLPCLWQSSDGQASVELVSASGIAAVGNLTTGLSITTPTDSLVALAGADAIGTDGTRFTSRTHALGRTNGFEEVTAETLADLPLAASVTFARTGTRPEGLRRLTFSLYPAAPVPRWSIVFENVPLP